MSKEKLKPAKEQGKPAPNQAVPTPPAKPVTPPLLRKIDWLTFGITTLIVFIGYYLTLAGYTGYANFVHLKPSITLKPLKAVTAMLAVAAQWRETTADSTFIQPDIPVPGTAGHGGGYTGSYIQGRVDWQISRQMSAAVEAVHFAVSDTIKSVGGHDGNYLGVHDSPH